MTSTPTQETTNEALEGELILPNAGEAKELFKPNGLDQIIARIRREVEAHTPDLSTEYGRKKIASMARKVSSAKVRLDDLGKSLVADLKAQTSAVDAERKRMRDELDQLRDKTRQPLTEWEDAEDERVNNHNIAIYQIEQLSNPEFGTPSWRLAEMLDEVDFFNGRDWQEFKPKFEKAHKDATEKLSRLFSQTKKQEEEQEELKRLREAEAARLEAERVARAAEAAKREAEEAAELQKQAAERARVEAEERASAAVAAAEARAAEEARLAVERERQRVADAAKAEEEAIAKREANRRHVAGVNATIAKEISAVVPSVSDDDVRKIVDALAAGKITRLRIAY